MVLVPLRSGSVIPHLRDDPTAPTGRLRNVPVGIVTYTVDPSYPEEQVVHSPTEGQRFPIRGKLPHGLPEGPFPGGDFDPFGYEGGTRDDPRLLGLLPDDGAGYPALANLVGQGFNLNDQGVARQGFLLRCDFALQDHAWHPTVGYFVVASSDPSGYPITFRTGLDINLIAGAFRCPGTRWALSSVTSAFFSNTPVLLESGTYEGISAELQGASGRDYTTNTFGAGFLLQWAPPGFAFFPFAPPVTFKNGPFLGPIYFD